MSGFFQALDRQRGPALGILFCVSTLNFLDRYMFGILLPQIKNELHLSDTELGFVTGTAFALFYATMGVPIARIADRTSRRNVLAIAVGAWSGVVALTGLVQNFWQLAIARVFMGLGEAGATPPSHAIIGDLFPKTTRASALAIYGLGSPVGLMLGFILGGWISQNYGWRAALLTFGIPGALLAVIVRLFLKEPPRTAHGPDTTNLAGVVAGLLKRPAFVHNTIGGALYALLGLGTIAWAPSFFARVHHMPIATVGLYLALVLGSSQICGMLTGGFLSDRLAAKDSRWYMWVCALAVIFAGPFFALTFLWPTAEMSLVWMFFPFFLGQIKFGPQSAVTQGVAGPERRAVAAAVFFLVNGLAGGFGAQLIGILSDALKADYGDRAIGVAITGIAVVTSIWAAIHFMLASRTVREDFAASGSPA